MPSNSSYNANALNGQPLIAQFAHIEADVVRQDDLRDSFRSMGMYAQLFKSWRRTSAGCIFSICLLRNGVAMQEPLNDELVTDLWQL